MRLLEKVCNTPWLITADGLQTIVDVVSREHLDPQLAEQIRLERETRPAALAMRRGERLPNTAGVTVRDGVAHVPVIGPIVRYSDFFTRVSGLSSLETIAADFGAALESPEVRAILLEFDTPGGEVTGVAALAEAIYAARRVKPVRAYVDGMAASAGYWLASATDRIEGDPAAMFGSIGTVLAVRDPSKVDTRSIEFVSSQSPHKRPNPLTDDGRAQYQRIVDQTTDAFIAAVARNRGVTTDDVLTRYGAGGLIVGQYAVAAGLADAISTFEGMLEQLARESAPGARKEFFMPNWKDMWAGFFTAAQDAGAFTAPDGTPPPVAASLLNAEPLRLETATPAPAADPAQAERVAALEARAKEAEARAAELETQARQARVAAFVEGAIRDGKALPAERESLTALASALVGSDGHFGLLAQLIAARPAHQLTSELLPAKAEVLAARREAPEAGDVATAREQAKAYAERVNGKK
jgi:ClpP class serine protease